MQFLVLSLKNRNLQHAEIQYVRKISSTDIGQRIVLYSLQTCYKCYKLIQRFRVTGISKLKGRLCLEIEEMKALFGDFLGLN